MVLNMKMSNSFGAFFVDNCAACSANCSQCNSKGELKCDAAGHCDPGYVYDTSTDTCGSECTNLYECSF